MREVEYSVSFLLLEFMLDVYRSLGLYNEADETYDEEETGVEIVCAYGGGALYVWATATEGGSAGVEGWPRTAIRDAVVCAAALFFS